MANEREKEQLKDLLDEDKTFTDSLGIDEEENDIDFSVDIPTNPSYDDMIYLALKAYKNQMDGVNDVPLKSRSRYLEVAQQYLNIAATALKNKKDHELKEKQGKEDLDENASSASKPTISREELIKLRDHQK